MMTRTMILNEFVQKVVNKGYNCALNPDVVYNVEDELDLPLLIVEASRDGFLESNIGNNQGRQLTLSLDIYAADFLSADQIWENIKDVFQGQQRLTDGFAISNEVESTFEYDTEMRMCVYRTTFEVTYNTEL